MESLTRRAAALLPMCRSLSFFAGVAGVACAATSTVVAQQQPSITRTNSVIETTAVAGTVSPFVTLRFSAHEPYPNSYVIYRRAVGSSSWGSPIYLSGLPVEYADMTASRGVAYEYSLRVSRSVFLGLPQAFGAIVAGSGIPLVEQRGKVLLYIDETQADALAPELDQLQRNLAADGWKVYRHHGPREVHDNDSTNPAVWAARTAERVAMRATIRSYYDDEPGTDWALFIIGRAPVVYSGATSPDGHSEHYGAWATDTFYADVNGPWSDTTANATGAENTRNRNVPGDGKYDQSSLLSDTEMQTGRVDLFAMEGVSVGQSETDLLRQYLVRNDRFRRGLAPFGSVARRALIDDTFDGATYGVTAWQAAIGHFGREAGQVDALDWFSVLPTTPMLFAYGGGGGALDRARDVGTSLDFATKGSKAVFTMTFGSWFGDWDNPDNFLRAPLAGTADSFGLTNAWSGIGGVFRQHMALGATIGYSTRFTQNFVQDTNAGSWNGNGNRRHIVYNLMGDPTLRLHTVRPPAHVTAAPVSGGVMVNWEASPDAEAGYHIYRGASPLGPFTRLTGAPATTANPLGSPLIGTAYTDGTAAPGETYTYLVKAVKMETSASGTYANQSLGEAATVSLGPIAPTGLQVVATGTTAYALSWRDHADNETGYEVERRDPATGAWAALATLPANSINYTDTSAPVGVVSHYRVRAAGSGAPSPYAGVDADYLLPGAAFAAAWHKHVFASWDRVSLPVHRFNGSSGAVSVDHAASGVIGSAGVDYQPSSGAVEWAHGDTGEKIHTVTLLPSVEPRLTRLLRVNYSSPTNGLRLGFPAETFVQVQDPTLQTLPAGWSTQIIGSVGWSGYAEYKGGVFGLGARTSRFGWGYQTDSLRFVSVPVAGDCTLTARIAVVADAMNPAAQPGLMLRASLAGNAAMRAIMMPLVSQVVQVTRTSTNAQASTNTVNVSGGYAWLRVVRSGGNVSTFRSTNDITWTQVGTTAALPLSTTAYVGLFLSTNTDPDKLANPGYAQFDNVKLEATLTTPASFTAAPGAVPGEISLAWGAVPGATTYEVQRSTTPGSGFATVATVNAVSAAHADRELVPGATYYYRVRAVGPIAQSAYSSTASAQPIQSSDLRGWRYAWFATNDTAGLAGDASDPEGDGVPNLAEYASGGSPHDPDGVGGVQVGTVGVGADDHLSLTFVRDAAATDIIYTVECADDLAGPWSGFDPLLPAQQIAVQADMPASGRQAITVRDTQPLSASSRRFMRLRRAWQDPVWRVFSTGFEEDAGDYVLNATLNGKIDRTSGTKWSIPAGWAGAGTVALLNPATGTRDWRIHDSTTSGAVGATLDAGPAVAGFISTRPWTFRVSFSLVAMPASATENQFAIALGQATASATGKQWLRFLYSNGDLNLMVRAAGAAAGTSATQTPVTLGRYTDFAELGQYITLTLGVDPVGKRYTHVSLSGPKGSATRTAAVQAVSDGVIPWGNTTTGEPAAHLLFNSTTPVMLTLDIDDIRIGAVAAGEAL